MAKEEGVGDLENADFLSRRWRSLDGRTREQWLINNR
jgi:hypothetical protein